MDRASLQSLLREIAPRLAELLAISVGELKVEGDPDSHKGKPDLVLSWGAQRFAIEFRSSGDAAAVMLAARQAREFSEALPNNGVPLVAVPYMGEIGRRLCEEAGVSWLDLSGNARLTAPGLRVQIEGKPNRFKRAGRPRSLFAPKSARIARWLLIKNDQAFTQRELARASGIDEGFTSRIVRGLEEQQLIVRDATGAVRVADYDALLDALGEGYDFSKHRVVRGHIAARSSGAVLRRLAESLGSEKIEYAATGLAGAWLWSGLAGFRLVVLFVNELPGEEPLNQMGFHKVERGENVWLVQPSDRGVFDGSAVREGICCAHPVQIYLDLKGGLERSAEAAQALRDTLLKPAVNV